MLTGHEERKGDGEGVPTGRGAVAERKPASLPQYFDPQAPKLHRPHPGIQPRRQAREQRSPGLSCWAGLLDLRRQSSQSKKDGIFPCDTDAGVI